jgi:hypothetical protein
MINVHFNMNAKEYMAEEYVLHLNGGMEKAATSCGVQSSLTCFVQHFIGEIGE